jgi:hypothetical protein
MSEDRFIIIFSFGLIRFLKLTDVPCWVVPEWRLRFNATQDHS